MPIKTSFHDRCPIPPGKALWPEHWHHTCWNCGSDQCGYVMPNYYWCGNCAVAEHAVYSAPWSAWDNALFDRSFAASASSPA